MAKKKSTAPKKTRVIGGKRFSHKTCGTKASMTAAAKKHRGKGKNKQARVVSTGGGRYCLYTRG